jgi:hypothetical protein
LVRFCCCSVVGIKVGTLSLLDKCSTTWGIPQVFLFLVCFLIGFYAFAKARLWTLSYYFSLMSSWDHRCTLPHLSCFWDKTSLTFCPSRSQTRIPLPLPPEKMGLQNIQSCTAAFIHFFFFFWGLLLFVWGKYLKRCK